MYRALTDKTILVVDDLATIRRLVYGFLKQFGARVLEADCAEEAMRLANEHSIDGFLLDVNLDGTSGIDLCRAIRAVDRYRSTPIIFITAVDESVALQDALDAGGDDFIHKPIHPAILRARLNSLLQKTAYLRQVELMSLSLHRYVCPRTEQIARVYATTGILPAPKLHEVCVLFTDVRGFTELSQQLDLETLFSALSEHLAGQVSLVYKHGGYVDKFAGDGMMAVFDSTDMALKGCLCALDILEFAKKRLHQDTTKIYQLGMGIHKGEAMIGNLGSYEHLDYTLVGKTVNLAARLCGVADRLSIVVSQAVRDAVAGDQRVRFSEGREAIVRGFNRPMLIFDLSRGVSFA
ncbi:MAG: adenylate/guanylate cyclase domain-containing response regulator [Pseudomonadota bacterium]